MDAFDRRSFLKAALAAASTPLVAACSRIAPSPAVEAPVKPPLASPAPRPAAPPDRMPALFVGHGSPMNAIEDNAWSRGFAGLADGLPRPRAVLAVSAHWYVRGTFLTADERPRTIHDFGGFPRALYEVDYPAAGSPDLARRVLALVGRAEEALTTGWGLDHGTWSVLARMLPRADVPVVQLSIDADLPPSGHLQLGRALAPLRDEGILVLGSGNATHNLSDALTRGARGDAATPDWAARFDADVAKAAAQHDAAWLARALDTGDGARSHPSPDHFLPLLYVAGAADDRDDVAFPIEGFDFGSLSMRSIRFG